VGHVALDLMFGIERFPEQPTKTPAHSFHQGVGGMSANAAVALARLGADVGFVGPMGEDAAAQVFRTHFQREGVDVSRLQVTPGQSSSISSIILDARGERMIFNHKGSALSAPSEFVPAWLDNVDFLLTDPRCPLWAAQALRLARQAGITSLLDGDVSPLQDLQQLVPLADWVAFSEPGLQGFHPGDVHQGLQAALDLGAALQVAVVTLGPRGLYWLRRGRSVQHLPAFRVAQVIDTLGAGDAFHAGLGLAFAHGMPDREALRFGAATAALKCQRPHGILGAPSRHEVEALLAAQRF
jgi:sulfofructose kinase